MTVPQCSTRTTLTTPLMAKLSVTPSRFPHLVTRQYLRDTRQCITQIHGNGTPSTTKMAIQYSAGGSRGEVQRKEATRIASSSSTIRSAERTMPDRDHPLEQDTSRARQVLAVRHRRGKHDEDEPRIGAGMIHLLLPVTTERGIDGDGPRIDAGSLPANHLAPT